MEIKDFNDVKSLLFENLSIRQTIFKNTFWLGLADGVGKLVKLVLLIYVAKILGATEYGKFSFALAFVGFFGVVATLGLSRIVVRELSQSEEKEKEFSSILSLRIILSLLALVLILIGSFFVTQDLLVRKVILILGIYFLLDTFASFLNFFFQARQKMEYESWTRILRALVLTAFGLFVIFIFPSVENLSYAYLISAAISLVLVLLFFHLKVYVLSLSFDKTIWRNYLVMSWPLALSAFFAMVYGQIDSVIMGYLNQLTQTGWYNAAYRIVGGVLIPIGLVSTSFYPALSRALKESKDKLQRTWNYQTELMFLLALPVIAGGIILAPKIIDFIYDETYAQAIPAFQILVVMAGIAFIQSPFSSVLLVFNQQTKFLWSGLIGAVVNTVLNLVLIPRYSLYGAAISAAVTAFVVLLFYIFFTARFTHTKVFNLRFFWTGLLSIFSTLIMYFVITSPVVYNLNVILAVIVGAVIYFAVFFSIKFVLNYAKLLFKHDSIN